MKEDIGEFPSQALLDKTIQCWQPLSKVPLTSEDAREIVANVCGLFNLLAKLDRKHNGEGIKNPTA